MRCKLTAEITLTEFIDPAAHKLVIRYRVWFAENVTDIHAMNSQYIIRYSFLNVQNAERRKSSAYQYLSRDISQCGVIRTIVSRHTIGPFYSDKTRTALAG
jgi:hypothetical protein